MGGLLSASLAGTSGNRDSSLIIDGITVNKSVVGRGVWRRAKLLTSLQVSPGTGENCGKSSWCEVFASGQPLVSTD